jgi:membrane associated rhomboid family serine protease
VIPLRIEKPVFSPPVVTWVLIAANVAVFLWMKGMGDKRFDRAVFEYGGIPQNIVGEDVSVLMHEGEPVAAVARGEMPLPYDPRIEPWRFRRVETPEGDRWFVRTSLGEEALDDVAQKVHPWLTILCAMFMHAGWGHLLGNMWFLHVFGPSVEDTLGKLGYLAFYLLTGVVATAAHILNDPHSVIPTLGASGAIAGVMGGLAFRFPGAQVLTIIPIILWTIGHLPAWIFMLIYIGGQIFMSIAHSSDSGGVAWWAHIGGFGAGYFLIRVFPVSKAWKRVFSPSRNDPFS